VKTKAKDMRTIIIVHKCEKKEQSIVLGQHKDRCNFSKECKQHYRKKNKGGSQRR